MPMFRFQEVSLRAVKRWTENGRKRQVTKKFWQTLSPFNRSADGTPKTYEQVMLELIKQRDEWKAERLLKGEQ